MVFDSEFIWYQDKYVFHITNKENIKSIKEKGLVPKIGERSKQVGDTVKGIYFFDNIYNLYEWIECLYKNKDITSLALLRFNLKRRKWFIHNNCEDFYIIHKVSPDKIEYLENLDGRVYEKELIWKKLNSYN